MVFKIKLLQPQATKIKYPNIRTVEYGDGTVEDIRLATYEDEMVTFDLQVISEKRNGYVTYTSTNFGSVSPFSVDEEILSVRAYKNLSSVAEKLEV